MGSKEEFDQPIVLEAHQVIIQSPNLVREFISENIISVISICCWSNFIVQQCIYIYLSCYQLGENSNFEIFFITVVQ